MRLLAQAAEMKLWLQDVDFEPRRPAATVAPADVEIGGLGSVLMGADDY